MGADLKCFCEEQAVKDSISGLMHGIRAAGLSATLVYFFRSRPKPG